MPLTYTPLNASRAEIRILDVLPGVDPEPIRCTLQVISLDESPQYQALSYVWGDETIQEQVIVDGHPTNVTANLEAALRALRHPEQVLKVWADALCINQVDIAEKNVQVPLMSRIFAEAASVAAWLGESDPDITFAIEYMLRVDEDKLRNETSPENLSRLQQVFQSLSDLPYWHRMWTFQEILLPERSPVLLYGRLHIHVKDLIEARHLIESAIGQSWTYSPEFELTMLALSPKYHQAMKGNLRDLLCTTCFRKCKNPRDHIYALYGMVPHVARALPPDYNLSPQQVMHKTAAYLMRDLVGYFNLFIFFCLFEDRLGETTTPSWVPDFSKPLMDSQSGHQYWNMTTIAKPFEHSSTVKLSADERLVSLIGWPLGKCKILLRFANELHEVIDQIVQFIATWREAKDWTEQDRTNQVHCFAKVIFSHDWNVKEEPVDALVERILEPEWLGEADSDMRHATARLRGKVVFITPSGRMGISVQDVENSNLVVASNGFRKPIILRLRKRARTSGLRFWRGTRRTYRLVGFCYVDGIMDDGRFDANLVKDIMQQKPKTFILE